MQHLCLAAADSVVEVLRVYQRQHSLRQTNIQIVHLIFTAALVQVYHSCRNNSGPESVRASNNLQFCCQSLAEIGQSWRSAMRALEVIICVKREWQTRTSSAMHLNEAVGRANESSPYEQIRKRTATTLSDLDLQQQGRGALHGPNTGPIQDLALGGNIPGYDVGQAWDLFDDTSTLGLGEEIFLGAESEPPGSAPL
jgi:hypothetical protein